ncbi:MAG: glutamate/tyrosine decarboxylase-like PLP-dependent enzyme [Planctomycetota bacterium]|jgi:glutamate/tyrosine decarboxylase-like PLP-dependent enzyme
MSHDIRSRMRAEMQLKSVFDTAQEAAYRYADGIQQRKVFPSPEAITDLAQFDEPLPQQSGHADEIVQLLDQYGSPATLAQTGGRYFGLVNGGAIPAALAVRWLSDFWDQNTPLYLSSPIASRLEQVTEGWIRELLGLPEETVAGFVSGSSMAIFAGIAAARFRLFQRQGWDINRQGYHGAPAIRVVASRQAHGTVTKAIALLGFGSDRVEWVDADAEGRIDANKVPELDATTILLLQAGNVNSGAFDDFERLVRKANDAGAWVHVDGAFGLWAAASPKFSALTQSMVLADSWSADAHKTLNTPYDCGIVLCRDRDALVQALQATGAYITYSDHSENNQRDGMLYTPEMSRRARIVELWAALKYLGREGVDELVYGLHLRAQQFATALADADFEILNEVVFNQILVACKDDAITAATIEQIQQDGECWVGGTQWQERPVIRISVCSWVTSKADIERSVSAFINARAVVTGSA